MPFPFDLSIRLEKDCGLVPRRLPRPVQSASLTQPSVRLDRETTLFPAPVFGVPPGRMHPLDFRRQRRRI
jgi:hypothetical protein